MNEIDWDKVPLEWKQFTIPKKHKKGVRHISAPCPELKKVQRKILDWFYSQKSNMLRPTWFAVATKGRGLMAGVSRHSTESTLVLEMDIHDFFDSMPVEHVKTCLLKAGVLHSLVDNVVRTCSLDGRFPQGAPTSSYLMEIGMRETDMMLSSFASKMGMVYTRYVDDLTFSFIPGGKADNLLQHYLKGQKGVTVKNVQARFAFVFRFVQKLLSLIGLQLNQKKNRAIVRKSRRQSPRINGVVLRQDNLGYNAPRRTRNKTRSAVHHLAERLRAGEPVKALRAQWAHVKGMVTWCDLARSVSPSDEASSADPRINESDWNLCKEAFS